MTDIREGIEATMHRSEDGRGLLRVRSRFDTTVDDLWDAVTSPARLERWLCRVDGDLAVGATVSTTYTSGWEGECLIERCDAPRELAISSVDEDGVVARLTARISPDGDGAVLEVQDTGIGLDELPFHTAGWTVHLEDLHILLERDEDSTDWQGRWSARVPEYRGRPIE